MILLNLDKSPQTHLGQDSRQLIPSLLVKDLVISMNVARFNLG